MANKKWKMPHKNIACNLPGTRINLDVYYDKTAIRKLAIEYHGGPTALLIACEGKAKNKRHRQLINACKDLPEKERFLKSAPTKQFLKNGKGGAKTLLEATAQWRRFIEARASLPSALLKHLRWSSFDVDPTMDFTAYAQQKFKKSNKKTIFERFTCKISTKLWTEAEYFEYMTSTDLDDFSLIDTIMQRKERLDAIPHTLKRYVLECCPKYIFDDSSNYDMADVVPCLEQYAFLKEHTPYKRHIKKKDCEDPQKDFFIPQTA
jgi:hypothetical protein